MTKHKKCNNYWSGAFCVNCILTYLGNNIANILCFSKWREVKWKACYSNFLDYWKQLLVAKYYYASYSNTMCREAVVIHRQQNMQTEMLKGQPEDSMGSQSIYEIHKIYQCCLSQSLRKLWFTDEWYWLFYTVLPPHSCYFYTNYNLLTMAIMHKHLYQLSGLSIDKWKMKNIVQI